MGVIISEQARFKLERLCDSYHPQEIGGYLLGSTDLGIIVSDIVAVPNYSQTPQSAFDFGNVSEYFADAAAKSVGRNKVGKFHSHPNGTIPSERDMAACGSGLWIWVCHRRLGEHSFFAAEDRMNIEVTTQSVPQETRLPFVSANRLNLGDVWINQWGKVNADTKVMHLLEMEEKARRAYLAFLQAPKDYGRTSVNDIAKLLNLSPNTTKDLLKCSIKAGLLRKCYGYRGAFSSVEAVK